MPPARPRRTVSRAPPPLAPGRGASGRWPAGLLSQFFHAQGPSMPKVPGSRWCCAWSNAWLVTAGSW
eukprot:7676431-Alexandrium_andersonii.AAC.1